MLQEIVQQLRSRKFFLEHTRARIKNKKRKHTQTLNPEGRTPPFRTLTCFQQVQPRSEVTCWLQGTGADHTPKKTKTKTKTKRGVPIEIRTTACETFLNGWRSSQKCFHPHTFLRTHISERPTKVASTSRKLRIFTHFPEDPHCEVCLRTEITKASCRRRTGEALPRAEKFGWLDNGWSQSPQWGGSIKEQSPIRCRGSRSCHSMDSILSVQNKDFTGDGKEFTKVPRAVTQAKSYLYRQFIGVWKILWWSIMESSNFNTSSIRDK